MRWLIRFVRGPWTARDFALPPGVAYRFPYFYTDPAYFHPPQDASGDAVMREALERIRDYEGDPRTPVRNSVRKSGIARAALNAMQAKEAK